MSQQSTPVQKRGRGRPPKQQPVPEVVSTPGGDVTLLRHTRRAYESFTVQDAFDLCASASPHALQELQELLAVRGMSWLNDARNRPSGAQNWSHVHFAATHEPTILRWLYENEATMNQLSYSAYKDVAPGATALHVAVSFRQLER
jgi:hypothetical protein